MRLQEFIHEPPFECEISPQLIKELFDEIGKLAPEIDPSSFPVGVESVRLTYHADDEQHVMIDTKFSWPAWGPREREFDGYVLTIHEEHAPFEDFLDEMADKGYSTEELAEVIEYHPLMRREIGIIITPDLEVTFWKSGVEIDIGTDEVKVGEDSGYQGMRSLDSQADDDEFVDEDLDTIFEGPESNEPETTFNTRELAYIYWVLEKLDPEKMTITGN